MTCNCFGTLIAQLPYCIRANCSSKAPSKRSRTIRALSKSILVTATVRLHNVREILMLNVQQLSAGYGESRIISEVTLEVPAGKVVRLMGRNGVGKTTLVKRIMGILKSKTGLVYLDGKPITHFSPN